MYYSIHLHPKTTENSIHTLSLWEVSTCSKNVSLNGCISTDINVQSILTLGNILSKLFLHAYY